ncbi:MAG: type II CAAX prenyl endopeptidase Rce1 family protein [Deltaproteobacteria bacterium]|jgi:membrane protease YdiL (CAAX protease family)
MTVPSLSVPTARRRLAIYLVLTFALSLAIQARIVALGGPIEAHVGEVFALMWAPGLVSLGCRLVWREGVADVSFRVGRAGGATPWLLAWLSPLAICALAYGSAWLTGLDRFGAPEASNLGLSELSSPVRFAVVLALTLTIGVPLSALTALGEEIGWRGYMLTRLVDAQVPHPILASGLVWGVWHLPLIVSGQYAAGPYPVLSGLLFLVGTIAGGVVIAYVRLESGSVWAATLNHAAWNATIQGAFDGFTVGGGASRTQSIWIGESGVLVVLVNVLVAFLVLRETRVMRRGPRAAAEPLASRT